ncbi:Putative tRNA (uracil-O(2)-)-methyltransferase [Chelonia mydas]|uniref:tRNA (uracil-O(2)-)-methyltransferase n=1 Tax=Chelonia mydas TaxID=8469 RepID=M7B2V6_CHEMY|nr:Putative tRNA (uracil-O(2)-)-methyltransferase [Chelonia mydas]
MIAQEDWEMPAFIKELGKENQPETDAFGLDAVLRTLFPKSHLHHCSTAPRKEMVIKDTFNGTVTFLPLEENDEGKYQVKKCNIYQIRLTHAKDDEWSVSVLTSSPENWVADGIVYPRTTWLGSELLSKLAKWSTEKKQSEFKSTLSLISVAKYSRVYQELKEKYKEMVKVWPEVTDPEKFVYEDVAIATYLLILWEEERAEKGLSKKQSFVDLGCGNGLLVHILSNEGVCLIGKSRTYPPMQEDRINKQRIQYINNRQSCTEVTSDKTVGSNQCDNHHVVNCVIDQAAVSECAANETKTGGGRVWLSGFQPREKVEQVRNCAALPRDFVDVVVLTVARLLLNAAQKKPWDHTLDVRLNTWNKGESLSLREVAERLDKETLKRLKNEYGGLQTLLRNNHQVFEVLNGRVHIRDWREEKPSKRTKSEVKRRFSAEAFKTRLCWFFIHHPDGCSLTSESCPYAHGTEELRQSQIMKKKKHPQ